MASEVQRNKNKTSSKFLGWDKVEKKIKEEKDWLRTVIDIVPDREGKFPVTCPECLLRKIAILIVSGQVKAREINRKAPLKSFWLEKKCAKSKIRPKIQHGQDWHRERMEEIENHFLSQGYEVVHEPNTRWGRADLGVYKKDELDLLIEVGTTSLFKLWINLDALLNFIYLIVPSDNKLIEFVKKTSPLPYSG